MIYDLFTQVIDEVRASQVTLEEVICEGMSVAQTQKHLANPDMRPHVLDGTIQGWLYRIKRWGKLTIVYTDTAEKIKNKKVDDKFLVKRLTDSKLLQLFGQVRVDRTKFNQVKMTREYVGLDAKKHKEEFVITVKLKKELEKAVKWKVF